MKSNLKEFTFHNRYILGPTDMIISRVSITMGKHYHDTPVEDILEDLYSFLTPQDDNPNYEDNWYRPVVASYAMMVYSGTTILDFTRVAMESIAKESDLVGERKATIVRLCQIFINHFEPDMAVQLEALNPFEQRFKIKLDSLTDTNSKLLFAGFIIYSLTLNFKTRFFIGEK